MPSARERILDAFEDILRAEGERAATIEAVARRAGVSKGGALYHFPSKDAMADALCDRLRALAEQDALDMRAAPDGPAVAYVRSSRYLGTALDHALIAVAVLQLAGYEQARRTLDAVEGAWTQILVDSVQDRARARAIKLIGDGLYYQALQRHAGQGAALPEGTGTDESDLEELLEIVSRIAAQPLDESS